MTRPTRILITASHPTVRADMRTIFQLAEGVEVVGEVSSLDEAIQQAGIDHPDVVLLDLDSAAWNNERYSMISTIKAQCPGLAVVVLTAHEYPAARESAAAHGADAIIIKGTDLNTMLSIIRNVKEEIK